MNTFATRLHTLLDGAYDICGGPGLHIPYRVDTTSSINHYGELRCLVNSELVRERTELLITYFANDGVSARFNREICDVRFEFDSAQPLPHSIVTPLIREPDVAAEIETALRERKPTTTRTVRRMKIVVERGDTNTIIHVSGCARAPDPTKVRASSLNGL